MFIHYNRPTAPKHLNVLHYHARRYHGYELYK